MSKRRRTSRTAIVFVGLPGTGKTYWSTKICEKMKAVQIEQDSFYLAGKCDVQSYLDAIEETVQHSDVVLCKNHHTKKSLDEVLEVLKRKRVNYRIFNFVPEDITDEFIEKLLDRIETRDDNSSHLKIDQESSRKRARQIIVNGFVKKYEEPTEPFVRVDCFGDVKDILKIITTYYFINGCYVVYSEKCRSLQRRPWLFTYVHDFIWEN